MPQDLTSEPWVNYVRELGLTLQRLRDERGLSQQRLATAAGLSTYAYQKLEKGQGNPGTHANPRLSSLVGIAEVMGLDVKDLLPDQPAVGVAPGRP